MKVVFVAGPYRAITPWEMEQNIRLAEGLALAIWGLGAVALCPHTMNRFFQTMVPDHVALEGVLELLRRSDAVYLLVGWERSSGTRAEKAEAERLGIPVFQDMGLLAAWLDEETHGTD
jgi:hypothetical protein